MDTSATNSTDSTQPVNPKPLVKSNNSLKTRQEIEDEEQSNAGSYILLGGLLLGFVVVGYFALEERRKADRAREETPEGLEDVDSQWATRRNVTTLPASTKANPNSPDGLYKVTGTAPPSYIQDYHDRHRHLNRLINFGNPIANVAFEEFSFTHFKPDKLSGIIRVVHTAQSKVSALFKCFPMTTNHFSCDYTANYSAKLDARLCSVHDLKCILDEGEYIGYIEMGYVLIPIFKIIFGSKIGSNPNTAFPIRFRKCIGMNKVQIKFGHRMLLHNNSLSFTRYGHNYDILNANGALGMPGGHLLPGTWRCPIFESVHNISLMTTEEKPVIVREDSDGIQPTSFTATTNIYKVKIFPRNEIINKEWLS